MQYIAASLNEIPGVCKEMLPKLTTAPIVLIFGKMGSGKTTFIAELCRQLNCTTEAASPTYSIVNEYETRNGDIIYHFDLYRLKTKEELLDIGFEEYVDSGHICLIEWPEMALDLIHPPALRLSISNENGSRRYEIESL